jgi:hypothetical protein
MSRNVFADDCSGCRPVLLDPKTKQPFPSDDPAVTLVNRIFDGLSRADKVAWHRFTCLNARDPEAIMAVKRFSEQVEAAGKEPQRG